MDKLKQKFAEKAAPMAAEIKTIIKEHGDVVLGDITIDKVYGGMKSMIGMVTETSKLDAVEGIRFRGYNITELREKLPKAKINGKEPLPEGIFYLMLIGELPTPEQVYELSDEWAKRSAVPQHVYNMLDSLPKNVHPMTQFSMAILALRTESVFSASYDKGLNKKDYWDATYEDAMNLIARLPRIAAYIYRRTYFNDKPAEPDPTLDWAANFAHMLGFSNNDFKRLMRLYLTIHADHEGGNVSAHATHLVGSALSDVYYSFSAAMNGLAGPLHGLANQEVVKWILQLREELGGGLPTKKQIEDYVYKTLAQGKVIPGYGHAVLRQTDPRFTAQQEFVKRYIGQDDLCDIVNLVYEVVPPILEATGKVKNPWPNVDAHSGVLLIHYGMTEYDFYTVLFGVSRALGVLAQLIWDRALSHPIERPGSVTTEWIKNKIASVKGTAKA